MSNDVTLTLPAFVRLIGVHTASPHAFFIGAGASISSGVPSAKQCIWQWKRDIFLTNNPGLEEQFAELSLPSIQGRIQKWLEGKGYPTLGDEREYGLYIEECHPIAENRRAYFQGIVQGMQPHVGYKLLCMLAQANIVRSVWTTNFDGLVAKAANAAGLTPIEVGIDCQDRVDRIRRQGELSCVSLHGDYRYDALKNTEVELQKQEAELEDALIAELVNTHLVVCGYSGRDTSIMAALTKAYSQPGNGFLYWCGYGEGDLTEPVIKLLDTARKNRRTAYYVPSSGFDDLLLRLSLKCLTGETQAKAKAVAAAAMQAGLDEREPFAIESVAITGVIKSNAFPIECPSDVFEFTVDGLPDVGTWAYLRQKIEGHEIVAGLLRGKVLALGTIDGIKDAFGDSLRGSIDRIPVGEADLTLEDGVIVSLFRQALVRCLEKAENLASDKRAILWDATEYDTKHVGNVPYHVHNSALLSLCLISGKHYVVVKPSLFIEPSSGGAVPEEVERTIKLSVLQSIA